MINDLRKCRNWQTSKTKDLVAARSCGFKSHLPHTESMDSVKKFIQCAEVSELADEQDSGSCERYAREGSSPFFRMMTDRRLSFRSFCAAKSFRPPEERRERALGRRKHGGKRMEETYGRLCNGI